MVASPSPFQSGLSNCNRAHFCYGLCFDVYEEKEARSSPSLFQTCLSRPYNVVKILFFCNKEKTAPELIGLILGSNTRRLMQQA